MCSYLHLLEAEDELEDTDPPTLTEGLGQPSLPPALPLSLQQKENIKTIPTAYRQTSTLKHVDAGGDNNIKPVGNMNKNENDSELKKMSSNLSMQEDKSKSSGLDVRCSVCKGTGALMSSHLESLEGSREPHTAGQHTDKSVQC